MEWVDHGYGIVHITPTETIVEFWWQDKLTINGPDVLGYQMIVFAKTIWQRYRLVLKIKSIIFNYIDHQ